MRGAVGTGLNFGLGEMSCGKGTGGGFDSSASFPLWTTTTNAYAAHMVEKLKASGRESGNHPVATSGSEDLQDSPFLSAAMTFLEPFPVGLVITVISAAVLRRKGQRQVASLPLPTAG